MGKYSTCATDLQSEEINLPDNLPVRILSFAFFIIDSVIMSMKNLGLARICFEIERGTHHRSDGPRKSSGIGKNHDCATKTF